MNSRRAGLREKIILRRNGVDNASRGSGTEYVPCEVRNFRAGQGGYVSWAAIVEESPDLLMGKPSPRSVRHCRTSTLGSSPGPGPRGYEAGSSASWRLASASESLVVGRPRFDAAKWEASAPRRFRFAIAKRKLRQHGSRSRRRRHAGHRHRKLRHRAAACRRRRLGRASR